MSMSSVSRRYIGVLVASLIEGTGLAPNMEPARPVVKHDHVAAAGDLSVAEHGSKPGVSMNTKPFLRHRWRSDRLPSAARCPPFIDEPSDFSNMFASPPCWLPGSPRR